MFGVKVILYVSFCLFLMGCFYTCNHCNPEEMPRVMRELESIVDTEDIRKSMMESDDWEIESNLSTVIPLDEEVKGD